MRSPAVAFRLRQRAGGDDDVHVKIIPGFVELKSVGGSGGFRGISPLLKTLSAAE